MNVNLFQCSCRSVCFAQLGITSSAVIAQKRPVEDGWHWIMQEFRLGSWAVTCQEFFMHFTVVM